MKKIILTPFRYLLRKLIFGDPILLHRLMVQVAEEIAVWNRGERQASIDINGIDRRHRRRYEFALELLGSQPPICLADAACGCGYGSRILAEHFPVVAIDIDSSAIDFARRHYDHPNIEYILSDILAVDCPRPMDWVVSFETLEHIPEAAPLLTAFHRWLRPDGRLLISTPNESVRPFDRRDTPHHQRHYTTDELTAVLKTHNFEVESIYFQDRKNTIFPMSASRNEGDVIIALARNLG